MVKARWKLGCIMVGLLLAAQVQAAPTVQQMLQYQPRQKGVLISTPTEAEHPSCEVKLVTGEKAGSSGWMMYDSKKRPLRRFFDSNGDKFIDVWSYYHNGLEVYREIDTNFNKVADQYRWLNTGGMKWGIDANEDQTIESWKMISSDEVAQEAFQALIRRDYNRLQSLFITQTELQGLGLNATYIERIQKKLQAAPASFQDSLKKVKLPKSNDTIARVESASPHCVPGESVGANQDLFRYPSRAILYQIDQNNHEWIQTGEMVKVGQAWRLLDVPFPGDALPQPGVEGEKNVVLDADVRKKMDQIAQMDQQFLPKIQGTIEANPEIVTYYLTRTKLIDELLPKAPEKDRESWLKQKADNLQAAQTYSAKEDTRAVKQFEQFKDQVTKQAPKSELAAYVTFRYLMAKYAPNPSLSGPEIAEAQKQWMEQLASFVQAYPQAEDTADALQMLGNGNEFAGKEDEAKRWYQELTRNFPQSDYARKAEGAIRRLELVGNNFTLAANTVSGQPFDIAGLKGKVTVVYYWANFSNPAVDFAKLKKLHDSYGNKGFELVTVSLDDEAAQAASFLQKNPVPGYHLYEKGGMSGPLANQYGIMVVPTMFLIGRDGNVISRTIQINDLEDEIKKALK